MRRKRVVLIQGAFEILNYGHIRAFKFAKSKGDFLIVALNTNKLIPEYKNRQPVVPWLQKKRIIEACRYVDKVVAAPDFSPLKLLQRYDVDVYVISREWKGTKAAEIAYMKKKGGRVCISRRFKGISTTEIKQRLLQEYLDSGNGSGRTPLDRVGARPAGGTTAPVVAKRPSRQTRLSLRSGPTRANGHRFFVEG